MTQPEKKQKDMIDWLIETGQIGGGGAEKINPPIEMIPEHLSDYPERVYQTLKCFYSVFKFPSGAIPSKKNNSKFSQWINELDELNKVCPVFTKMEKAMKMALSLYEKDLNAPFLTHPLVIKQYIVHAVGVINREIEDAEKNKPEVIIPANKENAIKKISKLLEEE